MSFQSVPDTVELIVDFILNGAPAANVFHFFRPGGCTQAQVDDLAIGVDSYMPAALLALLSPSAQYVQTRVKGLELANDVQGACGTQAFTGEELVEMLPNNVSLCLTLRTALTGRSARGRLFMVPPNFSHMASSNFVSTVYRDQALNYVSQIVGAANHDGWTHVICSRFTNKTQRPVGVTFPVTSVVCRNLRVDSQRGRLGNPV